MEPFIELLDAAERLLEKHESDTPDWSPQEMVDLQQAVERIRVVR